MNNAISRRAVLAAAAGTPLRLPKKLRMGIAGLDGHIREILDLLPQLPDVELVAVSGPSSRKIDFPAAVRHYPGYRAMLDAERLDLCGICGPNDERAPAILACADRKIHVVAEKPLALTITDLERVKQAVSRSGIRLTMLLPMRFSSPYLTMKHIVAGGDIGEVAQMQAQKSYQLGERAPWLLRAKSFGGTIPYIGVHMVDLMRWTSGREFVENMSFQTHIGFPEHRIMENTTGSLFKLDNGGVAVLHMDYLRPMTAPSHGDDRLRIAGTRGVVEYQAATGVTLMTSDQKPRVVHPLLPPQSLFLDFLESVYHGKAASLPVEDIYRVTEIVLLCRESAERGAIVRL